MIENILGYVAVNFCLQKVESEPAQKTLCTNLTVSDSSPYIAKRVSAYELSKVSQWHCNPLLILIAGFGFDLTGGHIALAGWTGLPSIIPSFTLMEVS